MQGGEKRGLFLDLFELRAVDQLLEPFAGLEQDAHIGDAAGGDRLGLFCAFARNTDTEGAEIAQLQDLAVGQMNLFRIVRLLIFPG